MNAVQKFFIVLLIIAGFVACGVIGCAIGTGAASSLKTDNDRLNELIATREYDLAIARESIGAIGKRASAIGGGLDESIRRIESIKDRNARIGELVKAIRACVVELKDLERWIDSGDGQTK